MKKLIFLLVLTLPIFSGQEPSKHQVTFSVTYNAITLQEAADIEKRIIGNHPEACKVEIEIKKSEEIISTPYTFESPQINVDIGDFTTDTIRMK